MNILSLLAFLTKEIRYVGPKWLTEQTYQNIISVCFVARLRQLFRDGLLHAQNTHSKTALEFDFSKHRRDKACS